MIFMVEYWDCSIFRKEYYSRAETAFARFIYLRDEAAENNPNISTVHLDESWYMKQSPRKRALLFLGNAQRPRKVHPNASIIQDKNYIA